GLGSEYKTGRADSQVISFRQDVYEFTGGVHPNNAAAGYNFSTETGELLTLKDVVSDETAAKEFIADEILQQTKESIYSGMLFDDYEDEIADVFSDAVWYFSEDGFHVICNEYILGPHFTGILEFVIPYDQFTLLNDEYLLRAEK
ncbi:MAG TPA: RsiV family protein, partial [Lachnospiraceae bacterium]|nr:RsiV family protein [Lachnospiraceae bacterium]